MKPSFQTSPDQSGLSLPESFISVTVLNHLRPTLKPALRLNPHMDHCPLYTVYWDHCLYDVWTTVQQLLPRDIQDNYDPAITCILLSAPPDAEHL